ncbi:MAG: ribonuclease HII [Bacteroidales bacterium]|jgi:ribonuclease HII|nr:ribonuclease HII [Bacteroidales bacterium]
MALASTFSGDANTIECGCDEAGRGCLAGPLFAAAVILPYDYINDEINDSKQLSPQKRLRVREQIEKDALAYAVEIISEQEIDRINILNASLNGMYRAALKLSIQPHLLLIDGNRFLKTSTIPYQCIIKGDAKYLAIAAASILAKTYRDEYMIALDAEYPQYHWIENKGYPTQAHQEALHKYGQTPYHRKSFHLKRRQAEFPL